MNTPASPATARATPAGVVRMILGSVFRRRSVVPPGPDFGLPARPEQRPVVPEPADAERWLQALVDELAAKGALDEGHADLLIPLVGSMVDVWDEGLTDYRRRHLDELARLERIEIDLRATLRWAQRRSAAAGELVAELDTEIERRLAEIEDGNR
jgi:hypothetical protein